MAVVLANKHEKEAVEMRAALCETLMQLAETREDIVYLDADLFGSSGMKKFAKAYPDRAFDVGIAEANMIGVAAGMSATGKTPFVHSFGPFATRRCFDQLFLSGLWTQYRQCHRFRPRHYRSLQRRYPHAF